MKAGIRTYLLADTTLKAALATTTAIYSFPVPQDASRPYLVLSRVSGEIWNGIYESLNIYNEVWQVDVYASTDLAAESLKELVIGRLNFADRVEMGSYTVYSCSLESCLDTSELETEGGEGVICRKTLEFLLTRDRTATT
jgi:hypothetical protein